MKSATAMLLAAAVLALCASSAVATVTPPSDDCQCDGTITCYESLDSCIAGISSYSFPAGDASQSCRHLTPRQHVFSCSSSPWICRTIDSAHCPIVVPARKKCQCRHDVKCYNTLDDCTAQVNMVAPVGGTNNEDCAALTPPRPFYVCWEEPHICRKTRDCKWVPGGHGHQDPHFSGFDGSQYYFDGEPGQVYNIITSPQLQVNAAFIRLATLKGTYMGRLGLRFGSQALTFDPSFGVFFNGALLTTAEIELPDAAFSISRSAEGRFRFVFQSDNWQLVATVAVEKGERGDAYINLQASLLTDDVTDVHGVLGQTARSAANPNPEEFEVEGAESDYVVVDGLLGTRFPVNRFRYDANAQPITATGSRLSRAVKPRFEAAMA